MNRVGVDYTLLEHQRSESLLNTAMICGIDPAAIAQAVFLDNSRGPIMAVIPLNHVIRLDWIESFTRLKTRDHQLDESAAIFNDCEPGTIPPIAIPYGLQAIIDKSLLQQPDIYFRPGRYDQLIKMDSKSFFSLHRYSIQGNIAEQIPDYSFQPSKDLTKSHSGSVSTLYQETGDKLESSVGQLKDLPALPETAIKLFPLHGNPDADFLSLAEIIELDSSLSAQLLSYANSSYFPSRTEITSIKDAISKSLGFNSALNLAIAISISRSFNIPKDGPIGLLANWTHSIFSATLCQELVKLVPQPHELNGSTAYLAGLLHDIGFLLMGHLRRAEFNQLNAAIKAAPEVPIHVMEQKIMGCSHSTLGSILLKNWGLPEPLVVSAREHHNPHYSGPYHQYAALTRLCDQLLKTYEISDASSDTPIEPLLEALGIDPEKAIAAADALMQKTELFEEVSIMVAAG
ncbi:MAG: HDOD domain-containing protein [Gammaproteobacteria bacterium]|nr:HDOD domain-containing protein [Gammaproteobacteria bacterium]